MRRHIYPRAGAGVVAGVLLLGPTPDHAQSGGAATTRSFTHPRLGMTVVATEIDLPAGEWTAASIEPAAALDQVFLVPRISPDEVPGRRAMAAVVERLAGLTQGQLMSLYEPLLTYASTHDGVGPNTFADLDRQRFGSIVDASLRSPWGDDVPNAGPFVFLVPATRIPPRPGRQTAPAAPRVPLVVELRPYVNDGKHWVLFSDGSTERVAVDRAWLAKYRLRLTAVRQEAAPTLPAAMTVHHTLLALRRSAAATSATVTIVDATTAERRDVRWSLVGGQNDPMVLSDWAMARAMRWLPLATQGHSPILQAWLNQSYALYGRTSPDAARDRFGALPGGMQMGQEPRLTSVFDALGGRAALRETLQLQMLSGGAAPGSAAAAASVPISSLKGVDVAALPFAQMLAGRPDARLALADRVPADRLFVYFAKPAAVFPFLGQGGDFLARTGSTITATAFDDHLKERYLGRLGLPEESSRRFLESGAVTEIALVAPDLFFLEGTDLTVLMRLRAPDTATAALRLVAGIDLSATGLTERRTSSGRSAYWARQGDVMYLSTSRRELERMLPLAANPASSLGRSAELRYMLTELPVGADTRAIVYLSDPFIRRMVGPAVKIGQLRRMRAAATMTAITAGLMLRTLDGHAEPIDVATLVNLGYVPYGIPAGEYRVQPDRSVVSRTWGTLADLTPIESDALTTVTAEEAEAYTTYVEEYRRYWRQFFDPIAVRLDDAPGGALEMTTFILPLVDSQLYTQLRGVLETKDTGRPLRVPALAPEPVLQVSLNLSDESWVSLSSAWSEFFSRYTGVSPEIFDLMGPGLHIAVQDADPVISVGTADLLGAFGGATSGARMDLMMPFALSILTRPCKIFIELQDAPRALALLRRAAIGTVTTSRELPVVFRQIDGRDAWMYTMGVPGVAVLRLGLEIQNGYLVLSNNPWSGPVTVQRVEPRELNGAAIHVTPDAVRQGLAALFATQAEHDQMAALASMGALLPLLQTISATPDEAALRHAALFGSTPLHPGEGTWVWRDGRLESSRYGSPARWKVPEFKPELGNFGLFDGATVIDLNMRFESGGLRAAARWIWR